VALCVKCVSPILRLFDGDSNDFGFGFGYIKMILNFCGYSTEMPLYILTNHKSLALPFILKKSTSFNVIKDIIINYIEMDEMDEIDLSQFPAECQNINTTDFDSPQIWRKFLDFFNIDLFLFIVPFLSFQFIMLAIFQCDPIESAKLLQHLYQELS